MNFLKDLCLMLASVFFSSGRTQEICDLEDVDCVTKGAKNAYAALVAGVEGQIEPMNSLFLEKINGVADSVNYELTDVTLTGFQNCEVTHLKLNTKESSFNANLSCPQIVLNFNYKGIGIFGPANVDSQGIATVTVDDYDIIFNGKYSQSISDKDQKPYFSLEAFNIETDLKGKLTLAVKNLVRNNSDQMDMAVEYFNAHYKEVEKYLRSPTIEKFVDLLMSKAKTFIGIFSVYKIVPK